MAAKTIKGIKACVFDAYGTLFDVASAANRCNDALGDKAGPLAELWRAKQLQYTWLRSLMRDHAEFWKVTGDALDYAMATLKIEDKALRKRLMELYLHLDAYPEVAGVLKTLQDAGIRTVVLTNGNPRMVNAAVKSAGLTKLLNACVSVESVGIFKPDPRVYKLGETAAKTKAKNACFMSSNGWDAWAAAHYGYNVVWVNRAGLQPERLPGKIAREVKSLSELPAILGIG